jgi:hypothetical protein
VGRRGMHSACGAYWNNERDGMWSFKYETKGKIVVKESFIKIGSGLTFRFIGMDVVISVIWIAV